METLRLETAVAAVLALSCITHLTSAASTQSPTNVTLDLFNGTTPIPDFSLNLAHEESTTSSIRVSWRVPHYYTQFMLNYEIATRKLDSMSTLKSPLLSTSQTEFIIEDLVTNSKYEVCVTAHFNKTYELYSQDGYEVCEVLFTIPLIQAANLVPGILSALFLIFLILLGVGCWHRAYKKAKKELKEQGNDEEQEELLDETVEKVPIENNLELLDETFEKVPEENNRVILSVPREDRPRSIIEEELPNIDFITPPIEEQDEEEEKKTEEEEKKTEEEEKKTEEEEKKTDSENNNNV